MVYSPHTCDESVTLVSHGVGPYIAEHWLKMSDRVLAYIRRKEVTGMKILGERHRDRFNYRIVRDYH